MQPRVVISLFRGFAGLLAVAAGLALCFVFRKSSPWPLEAKHVACLAASVLVMGGVALGGSYVQQRSLKEMKGLSLANLAAVVALAFIW